MGFIHVRHNVTQGEADIPEESLAYWAMKGFEPYDPPDEVEEIAASASLTMKRSELDALATAAGVTDPEALSSKQAVIDAIAAQPQPSETTSEED